MTGAEGFFKDGSVGKLGGAVARRHFPVGVCHLGVEEFVEHLSAPVKVEYAMAREGGITAFPIWFVAEFQGKVLEFVVEDGTAGAFLYPAGPGFQLLKYIVGSIGNLYVADGLVDGVAVNIDLRGVCMRHFPVAA